MKKFKGPYKELLDQMHLVWDELDRINDYLDQSVFNNVNYITDFNDEVNKLIKWSAKSDKDTNQLKSMVRLLEKQVNQEEKDSLQDTIMRSTKPFSIHPITPVRHPPPMFPSLNKLKKLAEAGKFKVKIP